MSTDKATAVETYTPESVKTELHQVKFSHIVRDPDRFAFRDEGDFSDTAIKSLAEDLALHGQVTPLLVRQLAADKYVNLDGHRRLAAIALNIRDGVQGFTLETLIGVNVIVEEASELSLVVRAISSNVQRQPLSAEGRCRAVIRLKQLGMPEKQIASTVGVSESTVARDLALGSDPEMLEHVQNKDITASNAAGLIKAARDADRVDEFKSWFRQWVDGIKSKIEQEEKERTARDEESLSLSDRWPQRFMTGELVRSLKNALLKGDPLEEPGFRFKAVLKEEAGQQVIEIDALSLNVATAKSVEIAKIYQRCLDLAQDLEPIMYAKHDAETRVKENQAELLGSMGLSRLKEMGLLDLALALGADVSEPAAEPPISLAFEKMSQEIQESLHQSALEPLAIEEVVGDEDADEDDEEVAVMTKGIPTPERKR